MASPRALVLLLLAASAPLPVGGAGPGPSYEVHVEAPSQVPVGTVIDLGVELEWSTPVPPPHEYAIAAWVGNGDATERSTVNGTAVSTSSGRVQVLLPVQHAGNRTIHVAVNATPGGHATALMPITVVPDPTTASISADPHVERYRTNLTFSIGPTRLSITHATAHITSIPNDIPQLTWSGEAWDGAIPVTRTVPWTARHGPGNYTLRLDVSGPDIAPSSATTRVSVPDPPRSATAPVRVTVEPPTTDIQLTGDSVNDDGKRKRPGDDVITRARLIDPAGNDTVSFQVLRLADQAVPIDEGIVTFTDPDAIEHRWSHSPLAVGPHAIVLSVGNARAVRTFNVTDTPTTLATDTAELTAWPGGATSTNVSFLDANFGSTTIDPGPVFGLPDLDVRLLRGSNEPPGPFRGHLGPWTFTTSGQARTSILSWPDPGVPVVSDGNLGGVELPLSLHVPRSAPDGTYRISIYEDGTRIGGPSIQVLPLPEVEVAHAPDPAPGRPHAVHVDATDAPAGAELRIDAWASEGRTVNWTGTTEETAKLDLPEPIEAGTTLATRATVTWPDGPPQGVTAWSNVTIPDVPPTVLVSSLVDGHPVNSPVLHPASPHELEFDVAAVDPNGAPTTAQLSVLDWTGAAVDWPRRVDGGQYAFTVPTDTPAGAYRATVTATDGTHRVNETIDILVASVRSIAVDGELVGSGPPGATVQLGELRVVNTGNVVIDGLQLVTSDPTLQIEADRDPSTTRILPGATTTIQVQAIVPVNAPIGDIEATIEVWGLERA